MNKFIFRSIEIINILIVCTILINCASKSNLISLEQDINVIPHYSYNIENENTLDIIRLDNAIQTIYKQLEKDIRLGSSVAILNFDSPSTNFSNFIINELTEIFTNNKKFIVTEQQKLYLLRKNENYQLSGYVSDETMVRIGHNVGAQFIISGYLIDLGTSYRFGIFAINIQDAVRVSQSSVYLSGYDDQVVFLLTGSKQRPSEKIIPPNLSMASSMAGFMQSASIMIGNTLINKIPRNSVIAITLSGDYVASDYVRNELEYILNNSNRFKIIPFSEVDKILTDTERNEWGNYTEEKLKGIGKKLNANVVLYGNITEYTKTNESGLTEAYCTIALQVLNVNSSQRIGRAYASWIWPSKEEEFFED